VIFISGGISASSEIYSPNGKCQHLLKAFPPEDYDIGKNFPFATWSFLGPFLTNVAIFESHFLEKKILFSYKLSFWLFCVYFLMF
jgi:hypothetical protein